jgi:hypothetical protein
MIMTANYPSYESLTDKCIYLDLDQTLLSTADEEHGLKYLYKLEILSNPSLMHLRNRIYHVVVEDLEKPGYGSKYEMWGITRPHLHRFLSFCFSYFRLVMVYSAGKRQYVESIVDHIFKDLPYPHLVLSYDDLKKDKNGKVIKINGRDVIKPLTTVMNANSLTIDYVRPTNTLGLDDLPSTYSDNKGNGILIPAYGPELNEKSLAEEDGNLLKLENWLMTPEVINCKDVRSLDKSKIFD